ncbi:hypothetical protein VNO78_25837 [Psophocarpus tetragonolobus]|uniref:Uncharacterized protein n=1 Tax=Psophocarpus tetragonolobus TaxID=3891 RepID=A0AAN9S6L0_PSOTE
MRSKENVANNVPKQVLPFCFVKMLTKYEDVYGTIQEAFEREKLLSRLNDLKNYYLYRHNQSTSWKLDILNLLHLALDNLSFANKPHKGRAIKPCIREEEIDNKKLNYMVLHGCKNLSEEKQLVRNKHMCHITDDASSSPLSEIMKTVETKYSFYNHHYKQNNCDKVLKEIKHFEVTRKKSAELKETIRNHVKIMSDELLEMRKKKKTLETKIKHAEKQIEVINEELWSFHKHLKDRNCRKDASLFMLQEMKGEGVINKLSTFFLSYNSSEAIVQ